ncbi:hypothetical protein JCM10450v2_001394 [Rhodotorula kratochvilovae]
MAGLASSEALSSAVKGAEDPTEVLYLVARHYIDQFLQLLRTAVTTDEQLSHASKLSSGSTIGKHARHLADHYRLLFDSVARAATPSPASPAARDAPPPAPIHVNYDQRTRNLAAETSHAACVEAFTHLREQLVAVTGEGKGIDPERVVRLHATTPIEVEVGSSFARELWFASFHAVHHFALIRVIAAGELGLEVTPDFGVAPSTLVHRQQEEESASSSKL